MTTSKSGKNKYLVFGMGFFLILIGFLPFLNASSIDKRDPIKETQTTPVPVTDELLNREGEPGPASPSFKLKDSADFFSREPAVSGDKLGDIKEEKQKEASSLGTDWLFWEKDKEGNQEDKESESELLQEE